LALQVGGCASTLAAWLGGPVDTLPKVLDWLIEHLPAYNLPDLARVLPVDLLQEEHARYFAEAIEEKQALYGIVSNDESEVQ
jgi:hypothetical protein